MFSRLVFASLSVASAYDVDDYASEWFTPAMGKVRSHAAPLEAAMMSKPSPPLGFQPNLVFILSDDQDTVLGRNDYTDIGSLEVMPSLNKHMMKGGARMTNAFVNTPICCPSRTEFFSGRMYHNVGPPNVEGSCMHTDTTQVAMKHTGLFGLLRTAGYEVGVFGKVTNDQQKILELMTKEGSASFMDSPLDYNNFMGRTYYHDFGNGTSYVETLDKNSPRFGTAYQSSQIGNRTLDWIDALQADEDRKHKPFFAYIGPHAPHYPAVPAPWYEKAFEDVTIPETPNYNLSCPDKTQHVRQNPPLDHNVKCWEDQHFRNRWRSLLSVDDIVEALYEKLDTLGLLETTFVFYSSDHGYKQGQWRIGTSKEHPYETDIRVPLLASGPGIAAGSTFSQISANIDVTPTLLDLAGVKPPNSMDGRSMVPWLIKKEALVPARRIASDAPWRDQQLIEYKSVGTYYNDHSKTWDDGTTAAACGAKMPRSPEGVSGNCVESEGVGDGNCYFVDSTHSNSWRALRILNDQENIVYIEYDPTFEFNTTDLQHYELYDINKDPYQMTNVYHKASAHKREELHAAVSKYFQCGGDDETPSTCHNADRTTGVSSVLLV